MLKKTKIICTMGPSEEKDGIIEELLANGMDIARFNFSHGSHTEHGGRMERVRRAAKERGKRVRLMLDTKGPEMRLGCFMDGGADLQAGREFTLLAAPCTGTSAGAWVNYGGLAAKVTPGDNILLADGAITLEVLRIEGKNVVTEIRNSGRIGDKKRVAVPGIVLDLPPLSAQDVADIRFGIEQRMDLLAVSFVQRAKDIMDIRRLMDDCGGRMKIIAKIENVAGVQNVDEILAAADGIMVARGDLGVEVPAESVPILQKEIIKKCNFAGKPVIVATQMLESMMSSPRPTRAEASDVANAILDGADAIMLSGETANGAFPVEAVSMMNRITERVEASLQYREHFLQRNIEMQVQAVGIRVHAEPRHAFDMGSQVVCVSL